MTKLAKEAAKLVEALPPNKAAALIEYARYLAEKADEEAWETRFHDPKYTHKLRTVMAEVEKELVSGKAEPLDTRRL